MESLRYWRPLRNLFRIFSAETGPRQVALGIAFGLVIGLLPKGNLLAVMVTSLMFAVRVNLGTGLTTALLVSWAGPSIDPLTHGIGVRLLQTPAIYGFLTWAYQLPVIPWTSLNNSVVLGSLILGGALAYPAYHLSRHLAQWLIPVLRHGRDRFRRPPQGTSTSAMVE